MGDFMKSISKKLAGIGLTLSMAASAMAAGPYDGIYQSVSSPSTYASVHQNGASLIVVLFTISGVTGVSVVGTFGKVTNANLDTWVLYQGAMIGTHAVLTGESTFHACSPSIDFDIDSSGNALITVTALARTALGAAQNVVCDAETRIGDTLKFNRAF